MTRPDLDALVKWARSKIGHYPAGSVEWHNNVQLLADALERLAREIADESARHEFTANRMKHEADCRDRAEAERDALREVVRAADAMYASADHTGGNPGCYRCDAADYFLAARAKVTL